MRRQLFRHMFTVSLATVAVAMPSLANAQDEQTDAAAQQFAIPAQALDDALRTFSEQADADVLYPPELVANKRSSAVEGSMAPAAALTELLRGTGVSADQVSPQSFALRQARVTYSVDPASVSTISGTVVDATTGGTLPGARVVVEGTNASAITDARGFFVIPDVALAANRLRVEYIGQPIETVDLPVSPIARRSLFVELGQSDTQIIVSAYLSSTQRALNQQLNAPNNATIVSADLLGSFPAENITEALRRVPGIAFGRDDTTGEGSRVTVRGFSSEAINIQLNGVDLQGTGFERTIDLSDVLTDNIAQITVHKSLLPSQQSTGTGGFIQIETKTGLDYGDFALNLGVEGETNFDRSFGEEYQLNATIAKTITPDFGISATVQYRKTDRVNYGADVSGSLPPVLPVGFTSVFSIPGSQQFPFDEEFNEQLITGVSYSRRNRDEENLTASLNLAWDIGTSTRLRLDLQRIQGNSTIETSRNTASFLTSAFEMPIPELDGEVRRRTTLTSLRPNLSYNLTNLDNYTNTVSFRGDTTVDRWEFKYKAGYTRARSQSDNVNMSLLGNANTNLAAIIDPATAVINLDDDTAMTPRFVGGGAVFADNGLPILSLTEFGSSLLNDPDNYNVTSGNFTGTNSPTKSWILEGSARYSPAPDWFRYIQVGTRYDYSNRRSQDDLFASTSVGALSALQGYLRVFGRDTSVAFFGDDLFGAETLGDLGIPGFSFPTLSGGAVNQIFNGIEGLLVDDPSTPFNEARFNLTDNTLETNPILNSGAQTPASTTEETLAAYVENMLEFGKFELIGGVRFEKFSRSGTTLTTPTVRLPSGASEPRETFITAGLVEFSTLEGTQTTWTPSVIVNYRPMDNLVARFAYNRTTVNPSFRLLRRPSSVNVDLRPNVNRVLLSEANPDLSPTITNNFDVDLSYYFQDSPGFVRAGFFYKEVKNNFTNVFFESNGDDTVEQDVLALFGDLATARPELVAFNDGTEFLRNRPGNGEGGTIYGFEAEIIRQLNFLPGFLSDFGVLGNVTYTTADFPTLLTGRDDDGVLTTFSLDRPLGDQSEWVYNASVNYAKDGFEGRLIYTYQSASPVLFEVHGLDTVVPSFATLDLRLSYDFERLGGLWTVYLQGDDLLRGSKEVDLTRAVSSEFNSGSADFYFPDAYFFGGGRSVTAGIRARF